MIPDPYTANLENITAAKRIAEQVQFYNVGLRINIFQVLKLFKV